MKKTTLIGIDCASKAENVGLALGEFDGEQTIIKEISRGKEWPKSEPRIEEWIKNSDRTLLALDAPLGWPDGFGKTLANHQAGNQLTIAAQQLFRRETDRIIHRELKKTPLAIGANLIAYAARSTLEFLGHLRKAIGKPIPLAWNNNIKDVMAIEVYPAATLIAHDYKDKMKLINNKATLSDTIKIENDHMLDAVLCVLAATDFMKDDVLTPNNLELAKKEGWIWVKSKNS